MICDATWLHYWIILTLGVTLTISEMLNTAIEKLCDIVMPEYNDKIKAIKDICAGTVFITGLTLATMSVWLILS